MLSKNIWSADKQKDFIYVTRFAYKVKLQIQDMFGIGKLDMWHYDIPACGLTHSPVHLAGSHFQPWLNSWWLGSFDLAELHNLKEMNQKIRKCSKEQMMQPGLREIHRNPGWQLVLMNRNSRPGKLELKVHCMSCCLKQLGHLEIHSYLGLLPKVSRSWCWQRQLLKQQVR